MCILIFSESFDNTTNYVVEYFNNWNIPYVRINTNLEENNISSVSITNGGIELQFVVKNKTFKIEDFKIVWARRGFFRVKINKIQDGNLNSKSFAVIEGNKMNIHIVHKNDEFRVIDIKIIDSFFKIETCFMKDSLTYQTHRNVKLKNPNEDFYLTYFESVFGKGFYKEIKYKNDQFFEYTLRFDSEMLKDRNYISLKNRLLKIIFRIKPDKVTKFKYLSFFEKYNYNIKNVYI